MAIVSSIGIGTGWQRLDSTPAQQCLYYGIGFSGITSFGGVNIDIDNTYFPSGWCYDYGTSMQSVYKSESGGFNPNCSPTNIYLWSLENDPITTTWSILNTEDFSWNIVDMFLLDCNLSTSCWEVSIPVSGGPVTNIELAGSGPFNGLLYGNTATVTTDPSFATLLQSMFGGQATITVNDNGSSCYIKVDGAYNAIRPKSIEIFGSGTYTFSLCGQP